MLQIASGNHIGSGVQYILGSYDSLYVAQGAVVGNTHDTTGANPAVTAAGSDQTITINGEVIADGRTITIQSFNKTDQGQHITIGKTGEVYSQSDFAILLNCNTSSISNSGMIAGHSGISMSSSGVNTHSEIINGGTIDVSYTAIAYSGSEAFRLTNSGTITSAGMDSFYGIFATGGVSIRNSGTMSGMIELGSGADTYDGRGGSVDGTVFGYGGNDRLIGGAGSEAFTGGGGRDILTGGGGADQFIFTNVAHSTPAVIGRDVITDFSHAQHDRINLSGIDAVSSTVANDAFYFLGTSAFDGTAGALRYKFVGDHTLVYADINGDKTADLTIDLASHVALVKGDFIL